MTFKNIAHIGTLLCPLWLSACTQNTYVQENHERKTTSESPAYPFVLNENFAKIGTAGTAVKKDRAAIMALQGEYKVDFDFQETVVLQAGYERHPPKHAGAFETVLVVKDTPRRIVLQHLLVVGDGQVVKHWRQDWLFEAAKRFEFTANQTWETKAIAAEKRSGIWTQCVYEVSDAPRYCGSGAWNHRYGVSTWTSDRTWRPLPRREYTVRDDYNALNVENRHTVTPQGWTHEQDNTKVLRNGKAIKATLVREFGFNNYRRISGYDFSPAYTYWAKTAGYWANVRQAWAQRFAHHNRVVLKTGVDGMPIIEATFGHAEAVENGEKTPTKSEIEQVFGQWVSAY